MRKRLIRHKVKTRRPPMTLIIKTSLTVLCVYCTYLILLPLVTALITPCLSNHPFVSYNSADCTVELALDRFMILALIGFGLLTIGFWVILKRLFNSHHDAPSRGNRKNNPLFTTVFPFVVPFLVTVFMMAACVVVAFLVFIPTTEQAVRKAPILLESVPPAKPLTK